MEKIDKTVEKWIVGVGICMLLLVSVVVFKPSQKVGDIPTQPIYVSETPTTLACSSTASTIVETAEASRSYIRITNISPTQTIFLGLNATATKNAGIAIPPLTSWNTDSSFLYGGAINCIASSSAASTSVQDVI